MERRNGLFDVRLDGWPPWRVMRGAVHRIAEDSLPFPSRPAWIRAIEALLATLRFGWIVLLGRRKELIVKTSRSALRMRMGDRYADIYFDSLLAKGHSFLKLEEINSSAFNQQAAASLYPGGLDPVVFTFWGRLLGRLFPVRNAAEFARKASAVVKSELGLAIEPDWLLMRVSTVRWQAVLYGILLRRVHPRVVFVSDTGEFGLCLACVRNKIPFVELQHGLFDDMHGDAVPRYVAGDASELLLPQVFAVRGAFWLEQLTQSRQGQQDRAVAVGSELIERTRARRGQRQSSATRTIVFSSQGLDTARAASWFEAAIAAAPDGVDWRLIIKLHPTYDRDTRDYERFSGDTRIQVIAGAEEPNIFDLLADADLHVSVSSACLFDAAAIGVASGILPLKTHEMVLFAVDGKTMAVMEQPSDLWKLFGLAPPTAEQREYFSANGYVDNLERVIRDLSAKGTAQ